MILPDLVLGSAGCNAKAFDEKQRELSFLERFEERAALPGDCQIGCRDRPRIR